MSLKAFKVPTGNASAQFVEKKSRFIGNIYKIESADEAADILKSMQKQFWDASHNVYAYVLENGVMRFSDDGEPQGTAGMPTLDVLKKEEVQNVLCVTTRYYGGTLLGAGGLVRAYSHACKIALDAAGISIMTPYMGARLVCPYPLLEVVRKQYGHFEVAESDAAYTDVVALDLTLPAEKLDGFRTVLTEVTSGQLELELTGERMFPKPLREPIIAE